VTALRDLHSLTAGIQSGNTSDFVAKRLLAEGAIAGIKYYPYHGIATALDDLEAGRIGLVIKLFPVISWLVKDRSQLSVALEVPTHEKLGIAFAKQNSRCARRSTARSGRYATMANLRGCRRAGFPTLSAREVKTSVGRVERKTHTRIQVEGKMKRAARQGRPYAHATTQLT
jgi:hypothetical protein